ncbi:hypothetical protein Poli38472_008570 [Pythium oligandrum]|uniref:Serine/threonine-protein kinase ATR n=1 Tax=Pythium oligandrum TaxID=41045 RepID=A0A8K1FDT3_PYTOL|nr:hypothetical protein Poli38472_008570 [Pythium oligandrum]|eukprot:TMW55922.1 hypothetical protein Poli38472_008570 [Pythium oligandrum]
MACRGSRPGTPNMAMDVEGGKEEKREESAQVSMDANGKKDDRVDVEKLLPTLHAHKRQHEDDTYPLSQPSTTKRCQEIAGRLRLTILRLLRKVAKAPDDKVAEILVGACEAIKLLVEGELCPHFAGIFLDFSGGANASRPQTVRGSPSVEPAVTTLLYLMTYASQVRYQDQQATVIDAMATLVLLMQQSDFYAFLHFFGDAVELLEDCVLLEGCLERRGFQMSPGKASIACFLDTAIHAYHSTSGTLGSTHTEILCGCVPVEEQSRVFERKEQLKTLLPQMKVASLRDLTYLRKAIEHIIIKITVYGQLDLRGNASKLVDFFLESLSNPAKAIRECASQQLQVLVNHEDILDELLVPSSGTVGLMERIGDAIRNSQDGSILTRSCIDILGTAARGKSSTNASSRILVWGLLQLAFVWIDYYSDDAKKGFSAAAFDQIQRTMSYHQLSWRKMLLEYPGEVYFPLVDNLLRTRSVKDFVSTFMGQTMTKGILTDSAAYVLPHYVIHRDEDMLNQFVLECNQGDGDVEMEDVDSEAHSENTSIGQLLQENISSVFKELIMHQVQEGKKEDHMKDWNFLFKFFPENFTIGDVLSLRQLQVLSAIAAELGGERHHHAKLAFHEISQYVIQGTRVNNAEAGLVMPRQFFLAIMTTFGNTISDKSTQLAMRIRTVKSIDRLFSIFKRPGDEAGASSVLDAFVPKVMAILKIGMADPSLQKYSIQAWGNFIRMLTTKALETNFISIVVSVLPYTRLSDGDSETSHQKNLDKQRSPREYTREVAIKIIRYLFVEKRDDLVKAFPKVAILPSTPDLDESSAALMSVVGDPARLNLRDILQNCVSYINHWDMAVRERILDHLYHTLVARTSELEGLVQSEGDLFVDPVVVETLVSILKVASLDTDTNIRLLCSKCLGALGAIDGARMPFNFLHSKSDKIDPRSETQAKEKGDTRSELPTMDLALVLIEDWLVKELRAAPENTDSVAFAIQELLKFLSDLTLDPQHSGQQVDDTESAVRRSKVGVGPIPDSLKRRFDKKEIFQFVEPYWSTNYSVQTSRLRESDPGRDDSTFYEDYRMSYEKWLSTWCRRLIKLSQAPERKIFNACRNILFECPQIARFLLPYLIQNVLRSGRPEVYEEVKREVIAVLKDNGIIDDGANGGYSATQMPYEGQDDARERAFADYASRHHQCAQTVFSTIDELNEWVWKNEKKRFASSASSRASGDVPSELDDHEKENLEEFLKDIPSQVLSSAAFRIRAHARALQYFEVYLRQQQAPPSSDSLHAGISPVELSLVAKHATYLQQLHSSTDEPDALTGLATLRRLHEAYRHADIFTERRVDGEEWTSLTYLLHQVVDFEQLAQWEDALACYEQAIQEVQSAQANRAFYSKEFPPDGHEGVNGVDSGFPTDPHLVKPDLYSGIVRCLIQLGRLESALQHINGIVTQEPQFVGTLYPHALECAWRLSRWDLVSDLLNSERDTSLLASSFAQGGVQSRLRNMEVSQLTLVRVLKNFHDCDRVALSKNLQEARLEIMGPLAAAATESYERAYPLLHKLHFLHEVEQGFSWLERSKSLEPDDRSHEWTKQCPWDSRYEIMSASVKFRDPILALRRMMLQEADLPGEVSRIWLQYAKMARKEGYIRTANSAVMHAEALDNPYASLERAKLMVAQDRVHQALQILEPVDIDATKLDFNVEDPHFCAKNLLLATNWMQESGQRQGKKVIERYEAVIKFDPSWEKGYFFLAKYYEYLLNVRHPELQSSSSAGEESSLNLDDVFHSHLINLIKNYVLALSHGTKYLFQSMPRLLTLWFEFGELLQSGSRTSSVNKTMRSIEADVNQSNTEEQVLSDITRIMQNAAERLPAYEWLVCFPQVTSRICHPNPVVVDGVKRIMLKVLSTYPTQAMWPLLGLSRSLNAQRRARARDIVANAQRQFVSCGQNEVANSFAEGMRLAEELISLAGHDPGNQRRIQIRLTRLRAQILVPIQATLNTVLPSSGLAPGDERHAAFSSTSVVYIRSFIDRADVMMTKEKPKRIVIHGTDGKQYPFLCKREKTGDLRKDARMMEFNTMINKLLQKDREGRKRKLRLRTYAVVCLNEESGLMEWVPNTRAMRQLIGQIHKTERGLIPPVRLTQEIKERYLGMQKKYADHIPTMATYYRRKILSLPVFTPRFHQWFTNNFADPTAWFEARLMFSRSAAVWSMVGHIIGLGDRHGENILIDTTNGECVHVDFDCLFDKGLKLAKPEIVPFRLTPNMIDAFGITGYEGVFRRVCEVTMGLLRENKETLRSVLEAFIHDPLVEWGRRGKNTQGSTTGTTGRSIAEITSDRSKEETRVILKAIDGRLSGVYNLGEAIRPQITPAHRKLLPENETLPLSVQGQVDKLIHEATAHENLAQMYIGWMPFL